METKEFKIQVPEGYEIDRENSTFEKIVFKKIERDLPKRWEDLELICGFYVDSDSEICDCRSSVLAFGECKNTFPTEEEAEACLALAQLCQLRDRYNDGWKPDWEDDEEQKHVMFIHREEICKETFFTVQQSLAFKTEELRDKFLENFRDLIEIAKPLL